MVIQNKMIDIAGKAIAKLDNCADARFCDIKHWKECLCRKQAFAALASTSGVLYADGYRDAIKRAANIVDAARPDVTRDQISSVIRAQTPE